MGPSQMTAQVRYERPRFNMTMGSFNVSHLDGRTRYNDLFESRIVELISVNSSGSFEFVSMEETCLGARRIPDPLSCPTFKYEKCFEGFGADCDVWTSTVQPLE